MSRPGRESKKVLKIFFPIILDLTTSELFAMAVVDLILGVVKAVVFIYDIVTFPVYQVRKCLKIQIHRSVDYIT